MEKIQVSKQCLSRDFLQVDRERDHVTCSQISHTYALVNRCLSDTPLEIYPSYFCGHISGSSFRNDINTGHHIRI